MARSKGTVINYDFFRQINVYENETSISTHTGKLEIIDLNNRIYIVSLDNHRWYIEPSDSLVFNKHNKRIRLTHQDPQGITDKDSSLLVKIINDLPPSFENVPVGDLQRTTDPAAVTQSVCDKIAYLKGVLALPIV